MSDIAITVEGLSKVYRIGLKEQQHETLFSAATGWLKAPMTNFKRLRNLSRFEDAGVGEDVFRALQNVSFQVRRGEAVGIIGQNGAGKSTLLKILSRITPPTSGRVRIYGRVTSLLEVGTGFHPDLTGRENIYLNGTILGMRKREIDTKFDEIVDFSGVEKFIDTPVKRFSSGMRVRLAFSVAAHLESEILIIDEVLAVGDAEFQSRCLGKMEDVTGNGRTVLFVSHNMAAISSLCSRGLLIDAGQIRHDGDASRCIQQYVTSSKGSAAVDWIRPKTLPSAPLEVRSARIALLGRQPHHVLRVNIDCASVAKHKPSLIVLGVVDPSGYPFMQIIPTEIPFMKDERGCHAVCIEASLPPLIPGVYQVSILVGPNQNAPLDAVASCLAFNVTAYPDPKRTVPYRGNEGNIIAHSTYAYSSVHADQWRGSDQASL